MQNNNSPKYDEKRLIFCSKALRFLKDIGMQNTVSLRTLYFEICLYMDSPNSALNRLFNYDVPLIQKHKKRWESIFHEEIKAYQERQRLSAAELLRLINNSTYGYYGGGSYDAYRTTHRASTYASTWTSADLEDSIYSYSFFK